MREYVGFYTSARPHQGISQSISEVAGSSMQEAPPGGEDPDGKVVSVPVLGGLHHDYQRAA
jgi:hypothetical protein